MNIYRIVWIGFISGHGADVEVTGELSFDIRILNVDRVKDAFGTVVEIDKERSGAGAGEVEPRASGARGTAPALLECAYQYPQKEQFDAVLSDMMNQLTKIFVRAQDSIQEGSRRGPTRFRVVHKLDSSFFEKAFAQMAKEFRQFYNATIPELDRDEDPCENQEKIKEVWQKLLEHSQKSLERAGLLCVEEFLRYRNRADDSRARVKLDKLAKKELGHIRFKLLDKLCDDFQMCYNELL